MSVWESSTYRRTHPRAYTHKRTDRAVLSSSCSALTPLPQQKPNENNNTHSMQFGRVYLMIIGSLFTILRFSAFKRAYMHVAPFSSLHSSGCLCTWWRAGVRFLLVVCSEWQWGIPMDTYTANAPTPIRVCAYRSIEPCIFVSFLLIKIKHLMKRNGITSKLPKYMTISRLSHK